MGLSDFLKKNDNATLTPQPPAPWEILSSMILIPYAETNYGFDDGIRERISSIEGINVTEFSIPHDMSAGNLKFTYEGEDYEAGFGWRDFSIPQITYYTNQFFTEEETKAITTAEEGLHLYMKFGKNPQLSYQLQIKIADKIMPDLAGIMDESAVKLLCARWVRQTAYSNVLPSPASLFNVQAVSSQSGEVWLHTHGLIRCGLTELEILQSDTENYHNHYSVISTFASYLIDHIPDKIDSAYIGCFYDNSPLVVTRLLWTEGLKQYNDLELGGINDRKNMHNSQTSILFAFTSEENEKTQVYTKIPEFNALLANNPLFFISDNETNRMSLLAREKYDCLKTALNNTDMHILVKVGLPTAHDSSPDHEHIWFKLQSFDGESFIAELTQEPYDVPDMHEGDIGTYTVNDITDWIVYTPNGQITPETAYLLM
ncbi:MAG: DUF4026 domain-containing protein [Lachnospiraceae bacterium]|nr:DUF4026 domain-containing protein [Lachnospiraceae bacterium]